MDAPRRPLFGTRRLAVVMSSMAAMAAMSAQIVRVPLPLLSRSQRENLKSGGAGNAQTYFPPEKRNAGRERTRRLRQMANGTHGY